MVVPLGPGKFYGSSLPRPRFYIDLKFSDQRLDPPLPVTDPLLAWAIEAHWSMGGLSFTRCRLQGKIEGNVHKLRAQIDSQFKKKPNTYKIRIQPVPIKRRRVVVDDEEDEVSVEKNLADEVDCVSARTRSRMNGRHSKMH